ncbi:WhiB family transcriptional regulator [Streptomyces syringium]|uniref:helix-turn-helix transcriptional regulator n=1 Tax=Streptomyces syringium TaxID=76729 RepID=UPI003AAD25BE
MSASTAAPDFRAQTTTALPCWTSPHLFHVPDVESDGELDTDEAKAKRKEAEAKRVAAAIDLCLDCPLMLACRDWARAARTHGVAGGESEEERAAAGYASPSARRETRARETQRETRREREAALINQWPPRLTSTEQQTLILWAEGADRAAIAEDFGITVHSVTSYLYRLRRKLRTDSEHLTDAARALGLLPARPGDYARAA